MKDLTKSSSWGKLTLLQLLTTTIEPIFAALSGHFGTAFIALDTVLYDVDIFHGYMAIADWFHEDGKDQKLINNTAKFINTPNPAAQRSLFLSIDDQPTLRFLFDEFSRCWKNQRQQTCSEKVRSTRQKIILYCRAKHLMMRSRRYFLHSAPRLQDKKWLNKPRLTQTIVAHWWHYRVVYRVACQ